MGKQGYNVNDNEIPKRNNNVNDNVRKAEKVDRIADNLVRKFQAPNSRNFFCKCAWKLSENDIWTAYEQANSEKVRFPLKYFITLCQIKMGR